MASKRTRHDPDARYAMLPLPLMKHPAVVTLDHAAKWVLTVFAAQYDGKNNGTMMASDSYMAEHWGIKSKDTLYRSRNDLLERALIVETRQGMRMRKIPTLFAIAWREINNIEGQQLDTPKPAPFGYLKLWPNHKWCGKKMKWQEQCDTPRSPGCTEKKITPIVVLQHPDGRGG
jgi:hypothetical protein